MRGSQLSFTALEFKLLYFLASNPSIVFSRELIYERVWRESSLYGSKSVNDLICLYERRWACLLKIPIISRQSRESGTVSLHNVEITHIPPQILF